MNTTRKGLGSGWQKLTKQARDYYPPTCHLCMGRIDLTLSATHPKSWTLDHITPRAIAGPQTPRIEETRPAHRDCNSRKGARTQQKTRWEL